jgi:hypothetical protein
LISLRKAPHRSHLAWTAVAHRNEFILRMNQGKAAFIFDTGI